MSINNQALVLKKCGEVLAKASEIYGYDFSDVIHNISFDLRGKTAGQAIKKGNVLSIRFNSEAVEKHLDHILNDTIPHEIAHIVNFARCETGKNHNAGWKAVCKRLGGSSALYHSMKLTPARKTRKYVYRMECGKEFSLGAIRHNKIQRGVEYHWVDKGVKKVIKKSYFVKEMY